MNGFISKNPFTGKETKRFPFLSKEELEQTLVKAEAAQQEWRNTPVSKRTIPLLKLAGLIKENHLALAELATEEMGKPYRESVNEVLKCITACDYYARRGEEILKPQVIPDDQGNQVMMVHEPVGIVLGIFPWNFPYWQIIRSTIPVITAGNAMLVKPAPNTPGCSLALQELVEEAGFPVGVVQTIFADEHQISAVIADKRIQACTLTGSTKAGSIVAMQAARQIKKTVLELGGSDPFIVLEDANLEKALDATIIARFQNNGQSCIAAKRLLLHQSIADAFLRNLIKRIAELRAGDPMDPLVQIGPLARPDLRDKLKQQVDDSVRMGARVIYQHPQELPGGYFFPPTVLDQIPKGAPAYAEELFGLVLSVFRFETDAEAIHIANDTDFGLGASVWTGNPERATQIASALQCGQIVVNGIVKSNAAIPFGGIRQSGNGRELGAAGILEFCQTKTVWM